MERRGAFETETRTAVYKTWLSPPAVTLSPFCFSPAKTRVRFDSAFKSPVPQETKKAEEETPSSARPLTSAPLLLLLQRRSPCQTEG